MRMSRRGPALLLLTLTVAGCGGSGAKRSVDARVEALRFFGPDSPLVALVDTDAEAKDDRAALDASLGGLPVWDSLRRRVARSLARAGMAPDRLRALAAAAGSEGGLPGSQLAVGVETSGRRPQPLAVLVTDKAAEMSKMFEQAARSGRLSPAGELDDADLYTSRGAAFAVRDGVMLAAATPALVRVAIRTRDGDRGEQLDDRNVADLLEEVPENAPLDVYANVPGLVESDPAVAELAQPPVAWLNSLREVALAISGTPRGLRIDAFGRLDESPPADQAPPIGQRPRISALSRHAVAGLVGGGAAAPLSLHDLLVEAAPFVVAATVDGDELRATLRSAP